MGRVLKSSELTKKPTGISKEARQAAELLVKARKAAFDLRERAREEVIDLAVHMAKRVVGRAAQMDPSVLNDLFSEAILSARELEKGVVRVHPDNRGSTNIDALALETGFEVVSDPTLEKTGCLIIAGGVEVDATLSTAIEVFTEAMKGTGNGGD